MALELVQSNSVQPLGQFDGYDNVYLTVKGGEVGTITYAAVAGSDKAVYDAAGNDGYVNPTAYGKMRPAVTTNLVSGNRPLGLIDDGIAGYGTAFGSVVGGVAGQLTTGQVLGPHTATGSGKLTLWIGIGTYAVTLDAVDPAFVASTTVKIGDPLYATSAGLLTSVSGSSFEPGLALGAFLNFETLKGGSLVNTPVNLVSAPNSPTNSPNGQRLALTRALISFRGA